MRNITNAKNVGMMFLLDTPDFVSAADELKVKSVGQLITPLTRRENQGVDFAIDNGAFARFNAKGFRAILTREQKNRSRCIFVAAPDVVGSARRTLECFEHWFPSLNGWPLAFVCQDGSEDLPIPWSLIKAIFIGGTDPFKLSKSAETIIKAAHVHEKHVHVGRINTPLRFEKFEDLGVHSCDGTGVSRFSRMRREINAPSLLPETACDQCGHATSSELIDGKRICIQCCREARRKS